MTKYQQVDPQPGHGPLWKEPDTKKRAEIRRASYKAWQIMVRDDAQKELKELARSLRRTKALFWGVATVFGVALTYLAIGAILRAMGEIQ